MISIVTAYYNRKDLFQRTLASLEASAVSDFEVIAVDDGSDDSHRLEDLTDRFPFLRVLRLEKDKKWYHNPCIPFNFGFRAARGDQIILQNPECLHTGDILDHVRTSLAPGRYLTFGCYSIDQEDTDSLDGGPASIAALAADVSTRTGRPMRDGGPGWYNHSVENPRAFHFCCAIMKSDLERLGGFDERYGGGVAFDDNELIHRIRVSGMEVRFVDTPFVFHQYHYGPVVNMLPEALRPQWLRNRTLLLHFTEPSTLDRANGADWGNPESEATIQINKALDDLLLPVVDPPPPPVSVEEFEENLRHATELRDTLWSEETATIFQTSVEQVLGTIQDARKSWLGRVAWRSRFGRKLGKILKWSDHAKRRQTRGRHREAISVWVKTLSAASSLVDDIRSDWRSCRLISPRQAGDFRSLASSMEVWWKKAEDATKN